MNRIFPDSGEMEKREGTKKPNEEIFSSGVKGEEFLSEIILMIF